MNGAGERKIDWIHYASAGFVFLASFLVFNWTKAPTVSFWDCGEFIACAAILGIPHPPGSPLDVIIAYLFTKLPIAADIAVRVNLVSVISSAFTAMVGYLIVHRLSNYWLKEKPEWYFQIWKYIGGVSGGLTLAFSRTFWSSAVEAEVYGLAMLLTLLIVYLGILWWQRPSEGRGNQYLILAAYLAVLGSAVHMTVYLALPPILLLVFLADPDKRRDWRFWVTGAVLVLLAMGDIENFLVALAAWSIIAVIVVFSNPRANGWRLHLYFCLAAILGFSSQLFIPIRAAQEPRINENNPQSWQSFKYFLERKQYGQTNMLTRAFKRRGDPVHQFGRYPHMGFWGYFEKQYGFPGWLFAVPFFLGLWGLYESWRRSRSPGTMLIALVILGTVGLVWYMNFADGTRQDPITGEGYLEVRERDYFWTPGFIAFALAIGLGLAAAGSRLMERIKARGLGRFSMALPAAVAVLALAFPVYGLVTNFGPNQRINNFLPYDYAYNLLSSCKPNSVVFTNGDNDTFPLWALQEAYGIRKDVRIINLSLINTNWYIAQMKKQYGVPISLSDSEIAHIRSDFDQNTGRLVKRVQDKVIDNILETNQWKIPIQFSITCSAESRAYRGQSLDKHLIMRGMAYDVVPDTGTGRIDLAETRRLYSEVFRYRGTADPKVRKDENAWHIVQNYTLGFLMLSDTLRRAGDLKEALELAKKAAATVPQDVNSYPVLVQLLGEQKRFSEAESLIQKAPLTEIAKDSVRFYLGSAYYQAGEIEKSEEIYKQAYLRNKEASFRTLFSFYYTTRNFPECLKLAEDWLALFPNHTDAPGLRAFLAELQESTKALPQKRPQVH